MLGLRGIGTEAERDVGRGLRSSAAASSRAAPVSASSVSSRAGGAGSSTTCFRTKAVDMPSAPLRPMSAQHRQLSSKAQLGEQVEPSYADELASKAEHVSAQIGAVGTDDGSARVARSAYVKEIKLRRKLLKDGVSEEELEEAHAAVREAYAKYRARYLDPANAEEKAAHLKRHKKGRIKYATYGPMRGVSLVPDPHDHRRHPLRPRPADDDTLYQAWIDCDRAGRRLRTARKAKASPTVLSAFEQELKTARATYEQRYEDPRYAQELEARRAARRVYLKANEEQLSARAKAYRVRKKEEKLAERDAGDEVEALRAARQVYLEKTEEHVAAKAKVDRARKREQLRAEQAVSSDV